jgi:hypothetical protein
VKSKTKTKRRQSTIQHTIVTAVIIVADATMVTTNVNKGEKKKCAS